MEIKQNTHKKADLICSIIIFLLLFLVIFQLPDIVVSRGDHDLSSMAAFDYWAIHKSSYGKDIVQNVGPLGFIQFPYFYSGFFDSTKFLINLFLFCSLVFLLFISFNNLPLLIKIIIIPMLLFFGHCFNDFNTLYYIFLLLLANKLILTKRLGIVIFSTFILAILALTKGTVLFISLFIVLMSAVFFILSKRFIFAAWTLISFVSFFLFIWVLSGQNIVNIPAFLNAIISFSNGYQEAAARYGEVNWFYQISGFIIAIALILFNVFEIINRCFSRNDKSMLFVYRGMILPLVELFILFMVWKHGFVSAGLSHVSIFFRYSLFYIFWILYRADMLTVNIKTAKPYYKFWIILLSLIFCMSAVLVFNSSFERKKMLTQNNIVKLVDIQWYLKKMNYLLNTAKNSLQLPRTRAIAGKATISYFGHTPSYMVYNDLNYLPNPATISFAAWNPWIMKKEQAFFGDNNYAPKFILFDLKMFNDRLVAQDDSLAQLEILHRYEPVDLEAGNILLRRINNKINLSMDLISEDNYNIEQWIDIPKNSSYPIWVEIILKKTLFSRLMSFIYHPQQYLIEISFKDNENVIFQLVPQMSAVGFLIDPLILNNNDFLVVNDNNEYKIYTNGAKSSLKKPIKFRVIEGKGAYFSYKQFKARFKKINGLVFGNYDLTKLLSINNDFDKSKIIQENNSFSQYIYLGFRLLKKHLLFLPKH